MIYRLGVYLLSIGLLGLSTNGCMFMRLSQDLKQVESKEAIIRGRVSYDAAVEAPTLLLLFTADGGEKDIVDFTVMQGPGLYAFMVPRGTYYLAAFIDQNQNMRPEEGEVYGIVRGTRSRCGFPGRYDQGHRSGAGSRYPGRGAGC